MVSQHNLKACIKALVDEGPQSCGGDRSYSPSPLAITNIPELGAIEDWWRRKRDQAASSQITTDKIIGARALSH